MNAQANRKKDPSSGIVSNSINKNVTTKLALLGVALLIFTPTSAVILGINGFCFNQARVLGDIEIIEPAVRVLAENNEMAIDASESSVQEFLRRNPNCCAVDRHPQWRVSMVTGWDISEVEVNFEINSKHINRENYEKYYKRYMSVNACGKVVNYGPGTSTRTLEHAN